MADEQKKRDPFSSSVVGRRRDKSNTPEKQAEREARVSQIMKEYWNGDERQKEQAKLSMIDELNLYIRRCIETYAKDFPQQEKQEDIFQECVAGVLEAMKRYDPEKSKITTYFSYAIRHAISNYKNTRLNGTTAYFGSKANKVREGLKHLEEKRIELTIQALIAETGLTQREIEDGLAIIHGSKAGTIDLGPEDTPIDITDPKPSIEKMMIDAERTKIIAQALTRIRAPESSKNMFWRYYGIDDYEEPLSYTKLGQLYHLSPRKVEQRITDVMRKLKGDPGIRDYFEHTKNKRAKRIGNAPLFRPASDDTDSYYDEMLNETAVEKKQKPWREERNEKIRITF